MSVWITDAAKVLREAGLEVKEIKGWKKTSASGTGYPDLRFIMWHHDASPEGASPGALSWLLANGPAANIWVDTKGVWTVYCAGISWHAGTGGPGWGVPKDQMNSYALGIETDHTTGEPWPAEQLDSLRIGTAALMKRYGIPSDNLLFHYTWTNGGVDGVPTLPTYGRKNDPDGLNLKKERKRLARLMGANSSFVDRLLSKWR
jgi:hypothetical protein